jgi:hypothetical protein
MLLRGKDYLLFCSSLVAVALCAMAAFSQAPGKSSVGSPSDLVVEVRSATGSNTFRAGDPVNLELSFSSSTAHKYYEPCGRTAAGSEEAQDCKFFNSLELTIAPVGSSGPPLVFIDHPPLGGPDHYLSAKPVSFPYLLTQTFHFQRPGDYRVRLKITVGLNPAEAKRSTSPAPGDPPSVTVTRETILQIVDEAERPSGAAPQKPSKSGF